MSALFGLCVRLTETGAATPSVCLDAPLGCTWLSKYRRDRYNCSGMPAGPKGYNRGTLINMIQQRAPEQLQWRNNYSAHVSTYVRCTTPSLSLGTSFRFALAAWIGLTTSSDWHFPAIEREHCIGAAAAFQERFFCGVSIRGSSYSLSRVVV